jgi:hypothetical protein
MRFSGRGALAACVATVAIAGCGTTATRAPATGASPIRASRVSNAPLGSSVPVCKSFQLTVELVHVQGAMSGEYGEFHIANRSSQSCSMYGYPGVELLDRNGQPLPTTLRDGPVALTQRDQQQVPEEVVLVPGSAGGFEMRWSYPGSAPCDGPGVVPDKLAVTPPGATNPVLVSATPTTGFHGVDACSGEVNVSPVFGPPQG